MNIDAVITWVDGEDPLHQKKLAESLQKASNPSPESIAPTRFNQCGEIRYCVHSLLRFAPWLRHIYIVTDNQIPLVMHELEHTPYAKKLSIVDHREIFSDFLHYLPTFNSLSIETLLYKIKGLAPQFIYLNDDCSLIRPVKREDFFLDNKMILRGQWKTQTAYNWIKKILGTSKLINEHRAIQENSARLAGWQKHFFHLPHAPLPVNRQTLENFFSSHPHYLDQNIRFLYKTICLNVSNYNT